MIEVEIVGGQVAAFYRTPLQPADDPRPDIQMQLSGLTLDTATLLRPGCLFPAPDVAYYNLLHVLAVLVRPRSTGRLTLRSVEARSGQQADRAGPRARVSGQTIATSSPRQEDTDYRRRAQICRTFCRLATTYNFRVIT